ncbi:N-acetylmuramoyl-L-alanine amidase [Actinoallomurus purpureus]|uniref:N-acetylmuramoyl-L-alanine amidase n=1 Tax=Actinoallomurus purpureus TaxID=478114 RepID=UPI0020920992|nr:N-acetylmuramoyl-L-alanine amidase [Actinoallomurus purpureus]MCO6007515.1 N-acetylmuramoyl-L-alanine amidase [Actinoallomurus purpureus]
MINRRRAIGAGVALVAALGTGAVLVQQQSSSSAGLQSSSSPTRQTAFAAAAKQYKVPASVLLGVSYLESRWDANDGLPSTSGGYGPMHLIQAPAAASGRGMEQGGGDDYAAASAPKTTAAPEPQTLPAAAKLTGLDAAKLRTDPAANIRGGAALLAKYQRDAGKRLSTDPAQWYAAVTRYGGSAWFADEVFSVIRSGESRTTDDGQQISLAADPKAVPAGSGASTAATTAAATDCPASLKCEWIPAPYKQLDSKDPSKYGNHEKANRPAQQKISYIVIHDTESSYASAVQSVQDPAYLGWHFTIRSKDGHIAQHVRVKDVGKHAGNWYINSKSIGVEHEGYVANGAWYTEAMYRASAKLVGHLAATYGIPLDRGHILGHDNVPARAMDTVSAMHQDPGPYWDWAHYFSLLGKPLTGAATIHGRLMILPSYGKNKVAYTGCDSAHPSAKCPTHGGASIMLHTKASSTSPLVKDVGAHPSTGGKATMSVYDHSARAATGQTYAVAGKKGSWVAIWYLGQKAWFYNAKTNRRAVAAPGQIVTLKKSAKIWGMAYPKIPAGITPPADRVAASLKYAVATGQKYAVLGSQTGEYFHSVTYDAAKHVVYKDATKYYEIQFGHRAYFVKAGDVTVSTVA